MQVLEPNHPVVQEHDKFMNWLKENHPDIYTKYGRNFKLPLEIGKGVGVSNDWKISHEEHEMLFKVAESYYHPQEHK